MQRCPTIAGYPAGNDADAMAAYLGDLISLYTACAIRHDGLIEHVEKTK